MAIIKTIKSQLTDQTIYPITKANAVYMATSSKTVEDVIDDDLVHTTGGSITGVLQTTRRIDSIDQKIEDSYVPATTNYYGDSEVGAGFYIRDNNKESMGFLAPIYTTNHGAGIQFGAHRKVNDDDIYNSLWFTVNDDGTNYIGLGTSENQTVWQDALGLKNARVANLTSGTGANISVANNTSTFLGSTAAFSAGVYLIHAVCNFATSTVGRREMHLSTSSTGSTIDRFTQMICAPVNGDSTILHLTTVRTFTANTTYYLVGFQNSGGALNATAGIEAIKLHN